MKEKRKTRIGTVVSDKMDKTVVVMVESLRRHPLYKKVVRHQSKFKVHDESKKCKVGDVVKIVETRPLSKDKRWRVVEIIGRREVAEKEPAETI
jgi:small subunit ribosomal protein S17